MAEEIGVGGLRGDRLQEPLRQQVVPEVFGGLGGLARRGDVPGVQDEGLLADLQHLRPVLLGLGPSHLEPDRLEPRANQAADLRRVIL